MRRGRRGRDVDRALEEPIMAFALKGIDGIEDREECQEVDDERGLSQTISWMIRYGSTVAETKR